MLFGAPARPMPKIMFDAITQAVAQVPEIREAYVPQCYIKGDKEARQILVIGVDKERRIPEIMESLGGKVQLLFPDGAFVDIIPYVSSLMPKEARIEECRIMITPKNP